MAMDFFTVPTVTFKILYVFFIIDHAKRKIIHFNTTEHPTTEGVKQQFREAFSFDSTPKYLIFERDTIFKGAKLFIKETMGIKPKIISYRAPWQNGVAERWVLSVRTEMLNYLVILHEKHLRDFMAAYIEYYNNDRCHLSVDRDSPKPNSHVFCSGFFFGEPQHDIDQKVLGELFYQYLNVEEDFIKDLFTVGDTQLGRVFVHEPVLSNENAIDVLDYERTSQVIKTASQIGVSTCYCRHKMYHMGKACDRDQCYMNCGFV